MPTTIEEAELLSLMLTVRAVTPTPAASTPDPLAPIPNPAGAPQTAQRRSTGTSLPAAGAPVGERASQGKGTYEGFGRAAHGLFLSAVRDSNPALAEELHAGSGPRPFTASDLIGYSPRRALDPGRTYGLRFTALTGPVAQAIQAAAGNGRLAAGQAIELAGREFRIEAVAPGPRLRAVENGHRRGESWAAATTWEALSAPWLLGRAQPGYRLAIQFASPTTFKSQEKHVPVPMPGWVFGSLLERWNAFAPVALPPEARRYAEECLALSGYQLRTRPMATKEGGLRIGAVGVARYTAINKDRYWLSVMNLLADFALFAGAGAGTTMGLGQVRRTMKDER